MQFNLIPQEFTEGGCGLGARNEPGQFISTQHIGGLDQDVLRTRETTIGDLSTRPYAVVSKVHQRCDHYGRIHY